jgi:type II secretory pathway component PulF
MGAALPIYTEILISVSTFTKNNILYILGSIVLFVMGFRRYIKTTNGKQKWDSTKLKMPVFGRVIRISAVSQFTRTLSTLHGAVCTAPSSNRHSS